MVPSRWGQIRFDTDDGLDVAFTGFFPELKRPEERAVVGDGDSGHLLFGRSVEQRTNPCTAVKH